MGCRCALDIKPKSCEFRSGLRPGAPALAYGDLRSLGECRCRIHERYHCAAISARRVLAIDPVQSSHSDPCVVAEEVECVVCYKYEVMKTAGSLTAIRSAAATHRVKMKVSLVITVGIRAKHCTE